MINKIDTVKRDTLLLLVAQLNEAARFSESFMISAENGDGCADLMAYLAARMPGGLWFIRKMT